MHFRARARARYPAATTLQACRACNGSAEENLQYTTPGTVGTIRKRCAIRRLMASCHPSTSSLVAHLVRHAIATTFRKSVSCTPGPSEIAALSGDLHFRDRARSRHPAADLLPRHAARRTKRGVANPHASLCHNPLLPGRQLFRRTPFGVSARGRHGRALGASRSSPFVAAFPHGFTAGACRGVCTIRSAALLSSHTTTVSCSSSAPSSCTADAHLALCYGPIQHAGSVDALSGLALVELALPRRASTVPCPACFPRRAC